MFGPSVLRMNDKFMILRPYLDHGEISSVNRVVYGYAVWYSIKLLWLQCVNL